MYHILTLIALIVVFTLPLDAADSVSITMGQPETGGITMPNEGDGRYVEEKIGDVTVRRADKNFSPQVGYLYFRTSDDFAASFKGEMYIAVEYLDDPIGMFKLQYQNAVKPYAVGPAVSTFGTKKWLTTVLHVTDAKLERAQNYGADFRFSMPGYHAIRKVTVSTTPPPDAPLQTDAAERMKAMGNDIIRPADMEYTFGSDCDVDSGMLFYRLGVTSVESYVTWQTCEPVAKDQWDWSRWDKQVDALKKTGLKWVPFLILGPAYSTPDWFRNSQDHYPCVCLEHGEKSKIESLWNPHLSKYIDRFIGEFAKRYRDTGVIESVLLGIQGDFGEAIYSVWGGGWTFDIPGEYHNHAGFWCNDEYALKDFRKWTQAKYGTVDKVNAAWGSKFAGINKVDFPVKGEKEIAAFRASLPEASAQDRRKWLDFVQWYRDSMTRYSDEWIAITRKHFPNTPIYLCTGGDAPPEHGSNFAQQCKVSARHGAGIRITNEGSNYTSNFVITRWVAAAGKHYGAYYGFEPAGAEDEKGIVARIYNATASGARQLHDYTANVVNKPSTIDVQQKHLKFLKKRDPKVDIALWYPNTHMTIKWGGYWPKAEMLRDVTDYDYLCEDMLRDGALEHYKVLVMLHGSFIEESDLKLIQEWVKGGGTLVISVPEGIKSVEGKKLIEPVPAGSVEIVSKKKGMIVNLGVDTTQPEKLAAELVKVFKERSIPVPDGEIDGIFATVMKDGSILFLNTTEKEATKSINGKNVSVAAGTITEVK